MKSKGVISTKDRKRIAMFCKSCGCEMHIRADYASKHSGFCMSCQKKGNQNAKKHGEYKSRLYHIWIGLKHRRYRTYTPRVCFEWSDFSNFKEWAESHGYSDSLTLDRIDNRGDYTPDNCQWVTHEENSAKDKRLFTHAEKVEIYNSRKFHGYTQREMAQILGVSRNTIQRLEREIKNECL